MPPCAVQPVAQVSSFALPHIPVISHVPGITNISGWLTRLDFQCQTAPRRRVVAFELNPATHTSLVPLPQTEPDPPSTSPETSGRLLFDQSKPSQCAAVAVD